MSTALKLRARREKLFGDGRLLPLDRNAKIRILTLARVLSHRTEPGKHYGVLTAKFVAILNVLVFGFHNSQSGRCFPSFERIAEKAHCARSTVYEAIVALERAGILTWVNRITRIRDWGPDLFGRAQNRWRVIRTSNAYTFKDPKPCAKPPDPSKSEFPTGTEGQESFYLGLREDGPLQAALNRLGMAIDSERRVAGSTAKGLPM